MGQKTDARIFRQGITKKNWEFRNIEKNNEESSLFLYKTLEVQRYLNRFFGLYKMKIHNCKIFYSHSSLQVFISFYITAKTIYVLRKNLTKYSKKLSTLVKRTSSRKKNWKHIKKKSRFKLPSQQIRLRIKRIQKVKSKIGLPCYKANHGLTLGFKGFQEILLESLIKYTKEKIDVSVTLQNLNRHKQLSFNQLEGLKRIFKQLRRFVKNSFFKEAMNILFINILRRKSAKLLAEFISDQFRLNQLRTDQSTIPRKDNYFLGFIKQTTLLFVKCEASCLTGIKIAIKGRFNRAPRARTVKIHFGKFSLQSFNSKVDYYQSTAYTINGTFGVKVWLCENKFKKYMWLQPKKTKYKKMQKGKLTKFNYRSNILKFGCVGLKATKSGTMSSRHIEAARQAIVRKLSRKGKLWIRVFPTIPITAKPTEVRMGKGKGNVSHWGVKVSAGTILFEIDGVANNIAISAFKTGGAKLPVKTAILL